MQKEKREEERERIPADEFTTKIIRKKKKKHMNIPFSSEQIISQLN